MFRRRKKTPQSDQAVQEPVNPTAPVDPADEPYDDGFYGDDDRLSADDVKGINPDLEGLGFREA